MWVMDCIECHTTREERGSLGKRLGGKGESGEETWGERGSLGKRLGGEGESGEETCMYGELRVFSVLSGQHGLSRPAGTTEK